MSLTYVILRDATDDATATGTRRPGFAPKQLPSAAIEVRDLDAARAATLARRGDVRAVAPVMPMTLIRPVPDSTPIGELGSRGSTWGVNCVGAENSPFTGHGAIVAILDTGIDRRHPAFRNSNVEIVTKDFTSPSDDAEDAAPDENGHGTHCAGTVFGSPVNGLRIAVAPGIRKALIGKVLGKNGGKSDQIARAINWAVDNGANVVSMSLGIDFPGFVHTLVHEQGYPIQLATSMALEGYRANVQLFERLASYIAAQDAFGRSCLLVGAAGNESMRRANPKFEIGVSAPAVASGILSVSAVGESADGLTVADFSNTGARVAGPGVSVLSAEAGSEGLVSMNGTSMATPHVAGVAALWVEKLIADQVLSGRLLAERIIGTSSTAKMMPNFKPHDVGAGVVTAP
jgi:subtilisin family serine protease